MSLYSSANLRAGLRDFLFGRLAAALLSFIANILIVRVMSEEAYAGYATLTGLQLTLLLLISFGIERVMVRYGGEGAMRWPRRRLGGLIAGGLCLRALAVLLLAAASIPFSTSLADWLNLAGWRTVAPAFWSYTLFFGIFEILQAIAQSFMLQGAIRFSLVLQWGLRVVGVAAYVGLALPFGLAEVLWLFAATSAIPCLLLMPAIIRVVAVRPSQTDEVPSGGLRATLMLGWHNHLEKLASLPTSAAFMRLLAAHFLPAVATASYGFYQSLWAVFHRHMPTTLSMNMLEAAVAGRYAERRDLGEIGAVMSGVFKINLMVIVPLMAWLAVSGVDIVGLLTGGKYTDHAWVLVIITGGLIPAGLWQLLIAHANAVSMSSVLARAALLTALCVIPLVFGVMRFPGMGLSLLALAMPVFGVLQAAIVMRALKRADLPIGMDTRGVSIILVAGAVCAVVASFVNAVSDGLHPLLRIGATGTALASAFLAVMASLKVFNSAEFRLFERLHRSMAVRFSWLCASR